MKKQIITIAAVAVIAVLLFAVYTLFIKDSGIDEAVDVTYALSDPVKSAIGDIGRTELTLRGYDVDDDGWLMIRRSALQFSAANGNIKVSDSSSGGEPGVEVVSGGNSGFIPYGSFFKRLYDGTLYGFDGEALIANAILKSNGREELEVAVHAMEGYDSDGDTVTATGLPFIFPSLDRNGIAYLTVHNSHGDYSVYQENGTFYYGASRVAQFDAEQFSMVTTNCRYAIASYGKMRIPDGKTWEDYGLGTDSPATASYTIVTTPASDKSYLVHTVYIGKKAAAGSYYYARYSGGRFVPDESDPEQDKLVANLSKDIIYYFPVGSVEGSIDSPGTIMLSKALVTEISETGALLSIDNVKIEYLNEGIKALVKNLSAFNAAPNLALKDTSAISTVILDKKHAADYSSYEGGWLANTGVFGGFTSNDGKPTYIEGALAKYAADGKYSLKFGLLRDDANGALLPKKFTVSTSYDGVNYFELSEQIIPAQDDKTLKEYSVAFESGDRIRYVRVAFDVPQVVNSYVVFDEIRIYADGDDAQPTDSTSGIWRLVYPDTYIPEGRNFAYLDMNNFNNFVQEAAVLNGESVAYCGISADGDANKLKSDVLEQFGLLEPDKHFSYTYQGVTFDIYVSLPTDEGVYYAYSTVKGDYEGRSIFYTCDIIVALTAETAGWLEWDFFEFLDHYLVSMYIVEMEDMTISFDGVDYKFILTADEDRSDIIDVSYNGKSLDVRSFKYLYQSILSIYLQDEYIPEPGEIGEEYLRIKITSETRSPEIVFYRVSSTKCFFTVDGEGSYYALAQKVNIVRDRVGEYINGAIFTSAS